MIKFLGSLPKATNSPSLGETNLNLNLLLNSFSFSFTK